MQVVKSFRENETRIYDIASEPERVLTELGASVATRSQFENALAVKDRSLEKLYQDNEVLTSKCRQSEVKLALSENRLKELEESNQIPSRSFIKNGIRWRPKTR